MNVPVIDVGGTHVTAALADTDLWRTVAGTRHRRPLRSDGTAVEIIATLATAIRPLGDISSSALGVAMPGPFDYATGIGRFRDVGKFDALNGVDVGSALRAALPAPSARIAFSTTRPPTPSASGLAARHRGPSALSFLTPGWRNWTALAGSGLVRRT
jgi:glucokinase